MHGRRFVGALVAVGMLLVGSTVGHLVVHDADAAVHRATVLLLIGGAGVGFLYGAYWHATNPLDEERYPAIVAWIAGGGVLLVVLGVISVFLGSETVTRRELGEVLHLNASVGLVAGLLVGTIHAQSIANAGSAARAETKAEALLAERERRERLNDVLRHYILNGVNVISGYASQLRSETPEAAHGRLETIDDRAGMIATIIRHIRHLQDVEPTSLAEIDLDRTIESAAREVRSQSDVEVETPAELPTVRAPEALGTALELFCDAITSITESNGTLEITCARTDGTTRLTFAATPAGLPDTAKETLFEPIGSGFELEFFLAKEVLEDACDVRLAEDSGDRVEFELTFASGPGDARPSSGAPGDG